MFWPPHQGFQGHILNNLVINTSLNANYRQEAGKNPQEDSEDSQIRKAKKSISLDSMSVWLWSTLLIVYAKA